MSKRKILILVTMLTMTVLAACDSRPVYKCVDGYLYEQVWNYGLEPYAEVSPSRKCVEVK